MDQRKKRQKQHSSFFTKIQNAQGNVYSIRGDFVSINCDNNFDKFVGFGEDGGSVNS